MLGVKQRGATTTTAQSPELAQKQRQQIQETKQ
jgi:hypothetical protein